MHLRRLTCCWRLLFHQLAPVRGIVFPIAKSLAEAYESHPESLHGGLGAFLMTSVYQCDVIVCAMFLTGQASNPLIAKFAQEVTGIEITYARWAIASIVPALASLILVPLVIYRVFPPEIKHTPAASEFASKELQTMGPMKWSEWSCYWFWSRRYSLDDDQLSRHPLRGRRDARDLRSSAHWCVELGRLD